MSLTHIYMTVLFTDTVISIKVIFVLVTAADTITTQTSLHHFESLTVATMTFVDRNAISV